jgi:hypothetical protein
VAKDDKDICFRERMVRMRIITRVRWLTKRPVKQLDQSEDMYKMTI